MPEISIQKQCAALTDLIDAESFGEPIGSLPKQTDSGFFEEGNLAAGTWQCAPGKLKLDLDITEFCHLLQGDQQLWLAAVGRTREIPMIVDDHDTTAGP